MSYQFLLFEAKSIQAYLMETNKMKQLTGGSEIIDDLMVGFLDAVLNELGIKENRDIFFIRRAGGAFYAWTKQPENLTIFKQLWPLLVSQYAPGLRFVWTIHTPASENFEAGLNAAFAQHHANNSTQTQAPLPQVTTIMRRDPRTGRAATRQTKTYGRQDAVSVWRSMKAKEKEQGLTTLEQKITPDKLVDASWVRGICAQEKDDNDDSDEETIAGERNIAVVHIDGNGFGQLIIDLKDIFAGLDDEQYTKTFRRFSTGIQAATTEAIKSAIDSVFNCNENKQIRVRPVVIGGDDVTLIVPAEKAIEISKHYLDEFEKETEKFIAAFKEEIQPVFERLKTQLEKNSLGSGFAELVEREIEKRVKENPKKYKNESNIASLRKKLKGKHKKTIKDKIAKNTGADRVNELPDKLTACGSIVYIKCQQPFYRAYRVCESLCTEVKRQMKCSVNSEAQNYFSALGFHRVTDSLLTDYGELNTIQNHVSFDTEEFGLSLGAYAIHDGFPLPQLEKLISLSEFLRDKETDYSQLISFRSGELLQEHNVNKAAFERRYKGDDGLSLFKEKLEVLYDAQLSEDGYFKLLESGDSTICQSPIRDIEAVIAAMNSSQAQE